MGYRYDGQPAEWDPDDLRAPEDGRPARGLRRGRGERGERGGRGGGRGRRVAAWAAGSTAVVLALSGAGAYAFYAKLQGNIHQENIDRSVGAANRPKKLNSALNILLMGSDDRSGGNARYGRDAAGGADTMMLLHLSPGGGQALVLSFPRDLEVPVRACKGHPANSVALINSAFVKGGPTCSLGVIEDLTHIHIDHYVVVDFLGFKGVVNALNGVDVCLPQDVNDTAAKLRLSKGTHRLNGEQALAYVRARKSIGDGSDTSRIKRQQQFMASVAKKTLSAGTLSDPGKMLALLQAATKSMSTDDGFGVTDMIKLGRSLQGITAGKVRFATVPREPYVRDKNHDQLVQPAASRLFDAVRRDVQPPKATPTATPSTPPGSAAEVAPATVKVRVWNATGASGQARDVAGRLTALGYKVIKVATAPASAGHATRIRYGKGAGRQALTLARAVKGVTPVSGGVTQGVVDLFVGTGFPAIKGPTGGSLPGTKDGEAGTDGNGESLPGSIDGELTADGNLCEN